MIDVCNCTFTIHNAEEAKVFRILDFQHVRQQVTNIFGLGLFITKGNSLANQLIAAAGAETTSRGQIVRNVEHSQSE